ncbi:MAG: acetylglutamate kinase, partial [Actinomycetota bacterium]
WRTSPAATRRWATCSSPRPIATGLSGEDAGLFGGRRRGVVIDGENIDLGRVGDVVEVDPTAVLDHLAAGRIPVISSIAPDLDHPGQSLNVNADAAASALAVALNARKLVVLTDVPGLYADWPNRESLVSHLTSAQLTEMLPSLESGMIPKMRACLDAVEGGVDAAAIIDGRVPHSVLVELFTSKGIGTEVVLGESGVTA